ncbi:hypothetical protein L873DRAFT_1794925 [Choiromyces venosus 120613-1]|uniref:Extensin-like n=1 Tax=Choiromyces venosus 120613-1 TaxID=1336337 RepID=A0A3N4IZK9_9PEZI|nr:hypothetical protein L873DRAFT_1794925 [Choiromyces venosus 120613-1]
MFLLYPFQSEIPYSLLYLPSCWPTSEHPKIPSLSTKTPANRNTKIPSPDPDPHTTNQAPRFREFLFLPPLSSHPTPQAPQTILSSEPRQSFPDHQIILDPSPKPETHEAQPTLPPHIPLTPTFPSFTSPRQYTSQITSITYPKPT